MERARIEDVDPEPSISGAAVVRVLSTALETEGVAINHFELAPGDSIGYDYHRHLDQEEVFYVERGTVTFETESGDVPVETGELVRFGAGEFQLGQNLGDERAHVLALGAPRGSTEIEYRRHCGTCGEETIQEPEVVEESNAVLIRCTGCGSTTDEIRR